MTAEKRGTGPKARSIGSDPTTHRSRLNPRPQFTHRGRPPYDPSRPDCTRCRDTETMPNGTPCRCVAIGLSAWLDLDACRFAGGDPVLQLEDTLRIFLHRALETSSHTVTAAARLHAAAWALAELTSRLALEASELCDTAVHLLAAASAAEQVELEAA